MAHDTQEWLNYNSLRMYPFRENMSREIHSGSIRHILPNSFLVEAVLAVPKPVLAAERFYLSSVTISGTTISVTMSSVSGVIASGSFSTVDFQYYKEVVLTGATPYITGRLVFGEGVSEVLAYGDGTYTMDLAEGELEISTVKANPFSKLLSISQLGEPLIKLIGDVKLRAGNNIVLETILEHNSVKIHARWGEGLGRFCGTGCGGSSECTGALYMINGIGPDQRGNFCLSSDRFVFLKAGIAKIQIDTALNADNICTRPGLPGIPGPDGPAGAAGGSGSRPLIECFCQCHTCETCDCPGDGDEETAETGNGRIPGPQTMCTPDDVPECAENDCPTSEETQASGFGYRNITEALNNADFQSD